jgi:xanthine dehydrogenase D subunit
VTSTVWSPAVRRRRAGLGVGGSAERPDGRAKTEGRFAFSSDLNVSGMLWAKTLRSPHAAARIVHIDTSPALSMPGVRDVITADDVPGAQMYGLVVQDQPVFASDVVRYHGEPIAAVAADHPEIAARACLAIQVTYESLLPLVDPELAIGADPIHPNGNVYRHLVVRRGDQDVVGDVVVEGSYEVGTQDQAFMGPEAGLAIPMGARGVELHLATQDLHADHAQIAACLGLEADEVVLTMSGIGGAFGAREDLSLQVHLSLLAIRNQRAVKMVYSRAESFVGHVHRHPARMWLRHHANRDGELIKVEGRTVLDGGAYASTSPSVLANATCFLAGPYRVAAVDLEGWAVRTNNPPCGAMRGFGTVQACFGAESQMDKLATALDIDPLELRRRNVVGPGDAFSTGQIFDGPTPGRECLEVLAGIPLPPRGDDQSWGGIARPGGVGATTERSEVSVGVGYALSFKNYMFGEGFDDYSTASVSMARGLDGELVATVSCAAAEVGQGFVTLAQQIVRSELPVDRVVLAPADTRLGAAGSSSASRQAVMSGGAILEASRRVRADLAARVGRSMGIPPVDEAELRTDRLRAAIHDALRDPLEATVEFHHDPTEKLDSAGQGSAHVAFAFAAHRAVVEVDKTLGLVRVLEVATAQDVGKALNPVQVIGQIEGGIAQGLGLALMEELLTEDGRIVNGSFTDYLIPTSADMPPVVTELVEIPEPGAPFGAKGVGEPPVISSTPAIVAAVRNATGIPLSRVPVRPADIALA